MKSSAQLEREAEQTRNELARTLDELRERITPGQLVDEAMDYAKDTTGGEFVRNLSRQMAANPLPVMLIGAGISWLAIAKNNSGAARGRPAMSYKGAADDARARAGAAMRGASERLGEWSAQAGDTADEAAGQAADLAGSLGESARDAAGQAKSRMADATSGMSEVAASTYESMKSGATGAANRAGDAAADAYGRLADTAGRTGSAMAQSANDTGRKVATFGSDALAFCKSQPLVLAGLGLALGAMLGAIMPPTEAEDRLMGDTSDRIKDQARGAAQEQMEKVKTAVESGIEQTQTQAEQSADTVGEGAATSLVPQDDDANAKLPLE
jgi:uncharacterized protein YjbJ (UPF0337 family)